MKVLKYLLLGSVLLSVASISAMAQEVADSLSNTPMEELTEIVIDPLFEYVVAPEELEGLQAKTDYLMDHFWEPFDFKKSGAVDQNALNHAMSVYLQTMPYASEKKVKASVKNLIGNIKNNPVLTYQFTKAVEECLYSPRAEIWADEIYIDFLDNLVSNKKIGDSRKARYREQLNLLKNNAIGQTFPKISVKSLGSQPDGLDYDKELTLLEFTVPECNDCRFTNLKLDISSVINDLIEDGKIGVDIILLGDNYNPEMVSGLYPEKWNLGYSTDAYEKLDIRILPTFVLLDSNGKILAKNMTVEGAINYLNSLQ